MFRVAEWEGSCVSQDISSGITQPIPHNDPGVQIEAIDSTTGSLQNVQVIKSAKRKNEHLKLQSTSKDHKLQKCYFVENTCKSVKTTKKRKRANCVHHESNSRLVTSERGEDVSARLRDNSEVEHKKSKNKFKNKGIFSVESLAPIVGSDVRRKMAIETAPNKTGNAANGMTSQVSSTSKTIVRKRKLRGKKLENRISKKAKKIKGSSMSNSESDSEIRSTVSPCCEPGQSNATSAARKQQHMKLNRPKVEVCSGVANDTASKVRRTVRSSRCGNKLFDINKLKQVLPWKMDISKCDQNDTLLSASKQPRIEAKNLDSVGRKSLADKMREKLSAARFRLASEFIELRSFYSR